MNKYWSNEDDKKVSYVTEQPLRVPRANVGAHRQDADVEAGRTESDAFSYPQGLSQRNGGAETGAQKGAAPQYGPDRSFFISEEANARQRREDQYSKPPQYTMNDSPENPPGGGYQVHSEYAPDSGGGRRGNFWLKFLAVILVLTIIGGGAYLFRYDILTLVGNIFGEEAVWKFMPTPSPTAAVSDEPAYVDSARIGIKTQATREIDAVAGGLDLETWAVTEQNIVLRESMQDESFDYYLFAYDTGRLLGYYEGLDNFIPCAKYIFYIAEEPYLITSRGFPLADPQALQRSAGSNVTIGPMINGWATVKSADGAMLNFIGENGELISHLWYSKAFPFTADTTLAYVDTGNVTATDNRYALYLLRRDGETKRLKYVGDTNGIMESVCGMAFTQDGEMLIQDEALTRMMATDDVTAYVNCGALSVRDPETGLYALFVGGVQQYPFTFDSIGPMPSDLAWEAAENGYVTRCVVANKDYPLPRSYSFILKKGDTEQVVSIAAVSVYPIIFD
ncbi:MAG: hypothetical protein JW811_04530 [Clostridiales bacterium]|nr:hypothetical protein [Clostridiales bacterium]